MSIINRVKSDTNTDIITKVAWEICISPRGYLQLIAHTINNMKYVLEITTEGRLRRVNYADGIGLDTDADGRINLAD